MHARSSCSGPSPNRGRCARASASASALTTPICCQSTRAPMATACCAIGSTSSVRRKHVDDVDGARDLGRNRRERGMTGLAENLRIARIHGHDPIAVGLQVLCGEVARAMPIGQRPTTATTLAVERIRVSVASSIRLSSLSSRRRVKRPASQRIRIGVSPRGGRCPRSRRREPVLLGTPRATQAASVR